MNRLRGLGRALLLWLVRALYSAAPKPPPVLDAAAVRRLLVIRIDTRVGNVLLTTPLLRALRRGLPGAKVDLLVAAGKEGLVAGLADRILTFRKKDLFQAPWKFVGLVRTLRRERYDVVIEAGHWHAFSFTSLWLARATRAPVRIGHVRGLSERFLTHQVEKDPAIDREVPAKLELLKPLGIGDSGEEFETTVDREASVLEAAGGIVAQATGPVVSLNPGARKPDHRWPASAFGELAARLAEGGAWPLVLWGPGEEAIAGEVVAASRGRAVLAPPTDLRLLAAVFRRSALVVTNDTGPMHLAAATGTNVLAVLMAEDGPRWGHGQRFEGVPVRSGSQEEIEQVAAAASRMLAASSPSAAG